MTQQGHLIRSQNAAARWWETFYDDAAMMVLGDQNALEIDQQVDLLTKLCGISPGDAVMDQCCGLGQHAIELASRGCLVTGVDQSDLYIAAARRRATESAIEAEFITADALSFVHTPEVDAVVNWHSSYGYLPTDRGNQQMLECARRSLRPSGTMVLEYANMLHLIANFKPIIESEVANDVQLTRSCRIKPEDGTIRQSWTYQFPDGTKRRHNSLLRLYLPNQLAEQFRRVGFSEVEMFSGEGKQLTLDDPRCIVVAHR